MKAFNPFGKFIAQIGSFNRSARLFLVAILIDGVIYSAWMLFFNFYIIERGFDRSYLGLVNAMPSLSAMLFGIPLGVLSDRIGRKRAMLLGLACGVVCMGLEVTVFDPNLVLFFAFMGGLGNMLYYISQAPFMMQVSSSENRALLFSLNFGLVTLAGAVGNLFAGQLPDIFGNLLHVAPRSAVVYQAVLIASMALGLLTLLPLAWIREPERRVKQTIQPQRIPLIKAIANPLTLKLAIPNLIIGFGAAVLIPYMNVFFVDKFAISDPELGLLFSLLSLFTGIGSIFAPSLVHLFGGKINSVVITQSFSLIFLMMVGFSPWFWLASVGFLLRSGFMNMAVPLYHTFAMEQIEEINQGTVNSLLELAWQMGWTVGPYLSGVVQEKASFSPLFIATGLLYALANILTWRFFHESEASPIPIAISL